MILQKTCHVTAEKGTEHTLQASQAATHGAQHDRHHSQGQEWWPVQHSLSGQKANAKRARHDPTSEVDASARIPRLG